MGVFVAGRDKARGARVMSRNGTDYTAGFPEIVTAAIELPAMTAILDGEVVVLDEGGRSSFQLLQQLRARRRGLAYFVFDLLALDGEDLRSLPHEEKAQGAPMAILRPTVENRERPCTRCAPRPAPPKWVAELPIATAHSQRDRDADSVPIQKGCGRRSRRKQLVRRRPTLSQ
jgi:hypothetical protein